MRAPRLTPTQLLVISFLAAIGLGTALLGLPQASTTGSSIGVVDALFTATSAVCVTGLIVKDTPTDFTVFGLSVILLLIQIGGLGILTFSFLFAQFLGRKCDLTQQQLLQEEGTPSGSAGVASALRMIAFWVLLVESLGAAALLLYYRSLGITGGKAFAHAVFHSVSAFCNAGFSLESSSLMGHAGSVPLNAIIMGLIIIGGIGFGVLQELTEFTRRWAKCKWTGKPAERAFRFTHHARLVVLVTGVLLVAGTALFWLAEQPATLQGFGAKDAWLRAAFLSVTGRTAGFNTVDIGAMSAAGIWLLILLMAIGASPGGTGGGIKTTTLAVLFAALRQQLRGDKHAHVFDRRIPDRQIQKAIALSFCFLGLFGAAAFVLMLTDPFRLDETLFECMSALGTAGLSMGITSRLSTAGKILITVLMLAGRLGPLTLMLGLRFTRLPGEVLYAEDRSLVIG